MTAKGQVTIPREVRQALGLKEHDKVIFVIEGGRAIMRPVRLIPLEQLRGVAGGKAPFPGRDVERESARRHVAERVVAGDPDSQEA